ncbi:MAG TPA: TolC family protein, partial [Rhodocyclaceae bacterium]|nr:TolC family protein [Rhodocyclaceae bacterium]
MKNKLRPIPFLIALALAGCAVGPDYVRPEVDTPAKFKEAEQYKNWQQLNNVEPAVPEQWWLVFNDPVLNDLQEQVRIDNQNIKIAEAQYRAARAAVDSASAAYYPTINGSFGGTRAANAIVSNSNNTQSQGASAPNTTVSLSASASWELDVWGRIRRNNESADAKLEASAADLAAAKLSAQALLAQTYIQLRSAEATLDLQQRTVVAYSRYLDLTRNRFNAGVATPLDMSNAESQLATARASVLT